ncbi:hypothetical protein [Rhodospirillum sp. A1_3_36]|uniref:hypothetical protein n=1 Tax=Rhodospirillum sp. A1_3_36 TaxID=3391666 RepID=UPI0039A46372
MDRQIIVTEPFSLGRRTIGRGIQTVTRSEQAHPYLKACEVAGRFVWAKPEPVSESEPEPEPEGAADLVAFIGQLDTGNSDHFTKAGLPETKALSEAAGRTVTAAERDAAWGAFRAKAQEPE